MSQVASACIPCAVGHFSTSARLLNEAVRFKKEGLTSQQVLDDVAAALGEQNALERIDLTPEKIRNLPDWERNLAEEALERSRDLRHKLESLQSMEELEDLAADTEEFYKKLNGEWTKNRLEECPTCKIKVEAKTEEQPKQESPGSPELSAAEKRRQFIEEVRKGYS